MTDQERALQALLSTDTSTKKAAPGAAARSTKKSAQDLQWPAVESNPEVLTSLAHALGLKKNWRFVDVWGLDEDALSWLIS